MVEGLNEPFNEVSAPHDKASPKSWMLALKTWRRQHFLLDIVDLVIMLE